MSMVSPFRLPLVAETGVMVLEAGLLSSPKRTRASTAPDKLPFISFKTRAFLSALLKPISRRELILALKASSWEFPMVDPKTLEALFILGGDSLPSDPLRAGDMGGVYLSTRGREKVAEVDRRANPNFLPGLGGSGGG